MLERKQLLDYLPLYVQEYQEIQAIMNAEQPEIDASWEAHESVWNNQFIPTMEDAMLKKWEKILGITPGGTDTLEERRYRILLKFNAHLPFTYRSVKEKLDSLIGPGEYTFDVDNDNYTVTCKLALTSAKMYSATLEYLRAVCPANMVLNCYVKYNTHKIVRNFTHEQLAAYTHKYIREEDLHAVEHTTQEKLEAYTHNQLAAYTHQQIREEYL